MTAPRGPAASNTEGNGAHNSHIITQSVLKSGAGRTYEMSKRRKTSYTPRFLHADENEEWILTETKENNKKVNGVLNNLSLSRSMSGEKRLSEKEENVSLITFSP